MIHEKVVFSQHKNWCEEENREEISETNISQSTEPIIFNFGIHDHVHGEHKICKLGKTSPVVIEIQGVENVA